MADARAMPQPHFDTLERQAATAKFGMWVFLGSELLLFGGLFAVYAAYRARAPLAFHEGIRESALYLGSTNTVLLLTSSWCVAMAVSRARLSRPASATRYLVAASLLGFAFLCIKLMEYAEHIRHGLLPGHMADAGSPGRVAYFTLYYAMTGLHALHVVIGLAVLGFCIAGSVRRTLSTHALEVGGLYWHMVDAIWVFLWPLFYLTRGGGP